MNVILDRSSNRLKYRRYLTIRIRDWFKPWTFHLADTIEGTCRNDVIIREFDQSNQSGLIFSHNLSNESKPDDDDTYGLKELHAHSAVVNTLIRTISEESLPQEMLEEVDEETVDFFEEKLVKDTTNKLKKDYQDQQTKTPPPSPESKIKVQITNNDHSILLKILNDEVTEDSNVSSMTPSLNELEATLSDMLEKEDLNSEVIKREYEDTECKRAPSPVEQFLEPKIIPVERNNAIDEIATVQHYSVNDDILVDKISESNTGEKIHEPDTVEKISEPNTDQLSTPLKQNLEDSKPTPKTRKVSFCIWDEKSMADVDLRSGEESKVPDDTSKMITPNYKDSAATSKLKSNSYNLQDIETNENSTSSVEKAPENIVKSFQNLEDEAKDLTQTPMPPPRRNKSLDLSVKKLTGTTECHSENPESHFNDRLI